jgi:hypothetical protein
MTKIILALFPKYEMYVVCGHERSNFPHEKLERILDIRMQLYVF